MEANVPLVPKRVRSEIAKVLPGFASHTKFFSSFAGDFTPVAVNAADKRRLVSKIEQIKGQPEKDVRAVVLDWMESAIVREVRKARHGHGDVLDEAGGADLARAAHGGKDAARCVATRSSSGRDAAATVSRS